MTSSCACVKLFTVLDVDSTRPECTVVQYSTQGITTVLQYNCMHHIANPRHDAVQSIDRDQKDQDLVFKGYHRTCGIPRASACYALTETTIS